MRYSVSCAEKQICFHFKFIIFIFFPVIVDKIYILSRNHVNLVCVPAIIRNFLRKGYKLKILFSKNILLVVHLKL